MSVNKKINGKIAFFLISTPIITGIFCIGFGRYSLSMMDTLLIFKNMIMGEHVDETAYTVLFQVRLPRILLAMIVGAGLACSGAAFQGLFTNPLATPDTLGVASGASFGAVLTMMFDMNLIFIQLFALLLGLFACFITYNISKINGKSSIIMIVLGGIVVSAMFQAFVSLLKYIADPQDKLPAITYWLMGSMSSANYKNLLLGVPFIFVGIIIIYLLKWKINILSLQEEEAKSMGLNIKMTRGMLIIASSLITASCVSMCGQVGWIGLLIPHLSRMIMGSNNQVVIPTSISLGATFMLIIDTFARSATSSEIPLSILTAMIGAPFFIALLRKTGGVWA